MIVGVGLSQELTREKTYLETDLNSGECRDIALKPKVSVPSTAKLQPSESVTVSSAVSTGLQSVSPAQRGPAQSGTYAAFSQSSLPEKYHGIGNTQQVTDGGYTTSGTSVVAGTYSGIRNPPVTASGFPSDDVRKHPSDINRSEPRSGVYSLASGRLPAQWTASQPVADAGSWADRRPGPDAVKTERIQDEYQRGQVISSQRAPADGIQQFGSGRQLAANLPSMPVQVSLCHLLGVDVLEKSPCPPGSLRTNIQVLDLGP